MKHCPGCKTQKPRDQFHKSRGRLDGLQVYCIECKRKENPARKEYIREYMRKSRLEALELLGNQCACCGEQEIEFLEIDHIHNDGAEERKKGGKGSTIWRTRVRANPERYQILCGNCHNSKTKHGECIHTRSSLATELG